MTTALVHLAQGAFDDRRANSSRHGDNGGVNSQSGGSFPARGRGLYSPDRAYGRRRVDRSDPRFSGRASANRASVRQNRRSVAAPLIPQLQVCSLLAEPNEIHVHPVGGLPNVVHGIDFFPFDVHGEQDLLFSPRNQKFYNTEIGFCRDTTCLKILPDNMADISECNREFIATTWFDNMAPVSFVFQLLKNIAPAALVFRRHFHSPVGESQSLIVEAVPRLSLVATWARSLVPVVHQRRAKASASHPAAGA